MAQPALSNNTNSLMNSQPRKTPGPKPPPLQPSKHVPSTKSSMSAAQQKKIARQSSKPILFNWLSRKLGTKRADNANHKSSIRMSNRVTSSPLPQPANTSRQHSRVEALATIRRKTISLNGEDDLSYHPSDDISTECSSIARDSTWSPSSEADEDASLRPLPPSSPPSPSPSRSSSYLSDPRTFRSIAASTKPTTLLSVEVPVTMAHIAQAPLTPTSQSLRYASHHNRTASGATNQGAFPGGVSTTFSAFPPSPQSAQESSAASSTSPNIQAPLHTTHHPRNNPRPSSPPLDNASMLTLASSAYAIPGLRVGTSTPGAWSSAPPSAVGPSDSASHFGGSAAFADAESVNHFVLGEDLEERDIDASIRALRPRSSRRGSWESEVSRWSAKVQNAPGTPSVAKERSIWTANSLKTSTLSVDELDIQVEEDRSETEPAHSTDLQIEVVSPSVTSDTEPTPRNPLQSLITSTHDPVEPSQQRRLSSETVAKITTSADASPTNEVPVTQKAERDNVREP